MKLLHHLFSVKNEDSHKVVRFLGFKVRIKDKDIDKNKDIICEIDKVIEAQNKLISVNDIIINKLDCLINKREEFDFGFDPLYGLVTGIKYSPFHTMLAEAHKQTVDFIKQNMDLKKVLFKENRLPNLSYSVNQAGQDGLFLEFGVFSGETINFIAEKLPSKTIYGFDSFEGLPEDWSGMNLEKGSFKREDLPNVRDNVKLIKGWFSDTLPGFLNEHKENISFLHVDSDIYSSAKYVLETLSSRIIPGTIIVFDEYFNFPNWQEQEHKAFMEFCDQYSVKFDYISVGHDQVTVRILERN